MKQDKTPFAAFLSLSLAGAASTAAVAVEKDPFALKEISPNAVNRVAEAAGDAATDAAKAAGTMKGAGEMKCGANMMKGGGMMNNGGTMSAPKAATEAAGSAKPAEKPAGSEAGKPPGSH
ncbi:hypothetical protein EWI61_08795 [Methylolobus aquaticus]|nr:hypothetical protein EWI61_08795 [Methylolobus aquaticus]